VAPAETPFILAVLLKRQWGDLKAGEYEFTPGQSTFQVIDQIAAGKVFLRKLTIPEGYNSAEVVRMINEEPVLTGAVLTPVPDGSLLPETYTFSRGDDRSKLLLRIQSAMTRVMDKMWAARPADFALKTPQEWVTLASIVEKETGQADERPRVAAVFLNRLRLGMKLQSDPTVIYALTMGQRDLGRLLTTHDLTTTDSPYNTYRYTGLPPGPIANPGVASLQAVLSPAMTDDLYFVADGTGGHAFAATLDAHNSNVARWRALQGRANATASPAAKNNSME
jgi:UPF0755 protein